MAHETDTRIDIDRGIAVLTLNRSQSLNALNVSFMEDINRALLLIKDDPSVKVVVITGVGKAFSAGADVNQMAAYTWPEVAEQDFIAVFEKVLPIYPLPVIAAINGLALGGGLELAMMCDMIYLCDTARLGQPEISVGTIPGIGGTQRLTRLVGRGRAMELILTGRIIDAQEAVDIGLALKSVPLDKLMVTALATAKQISNFSLPLIKAAKSCINHVDETHLAEGIAKEKQQFYQTFKLHDRKEGMTAFVEKRSPRFTNT